MIGKFLFSGDDKLYLKGVTYGPFHPNADGCLYHDPESVERDFALMAEHGINSVRTYTVPPVWLLDIAWRNRLWVMVGVPWEQHITFLDSPKTSSTITARVREAVRTCAGHPAVLCFAIGNEIPASIVRWHGRKRIERFLKRLYVASKEEDPTALVTYVNFPPTEYLQLDFLDFSCFNVYLETEDRLAAYLARLQNLAGDRPLIIGEVGLDSRRNGLAMQAEVLNRQIGTVFSGGCGGVFVFAWTDEWSRGGFEIEDWDFGVTSRSRKPKPALHSIERAFNDAPFAGNEQWPRMSVVICSYNGERTIGQTISEVLKLKYPNYEVIVVDDGSTDGTPGIAGAIPDIRLIRVANGGLSAARNIGMRAATGDIVAYIDDDAYPDPHWLHYLAMTFQRTPHLAIGGPNLPPPGDGARAECVANAPGGPIHVLLDDQIAEHIPGCNFAVRRAALERIGGFDPIYRAAGDDVDACWRLQEIGTVGFAPAAVVWHHRRNSLRAYWNQQKSYGQAEALLERKWPLKYNALGHLAWLGRVYGPGGQRVGKRWRVYYGTWGSALFQSIYETEPGLIQNFAQMPEWYLIVLGLAAVSALGFLWSPLFACLPLLIAAIAIPLVQALAKASRSQFPSSRSRPLARLGLTAFTAVLFALQPAARLWGRIAFGLSPWRRPSGRRPVLPRVHVRRVWTESWRSAEDWLERFESAVLQHAFARRGDGFDNWDLHIRGGLAGSARVRLGVEEHGAGRQLLTWRIQPVAGRFVALVGCCFLLLSIMAASAGALPAGLAVAVITLVFGLWAYRDCTTASGVALEALRRLEPESR